MSKLTARRENKVDLKNKTYRELCELLERQDRILGDRRLVQSLPDNSEKVNNFRDKIQLELDNRRLYETLCKDMQLLDLDKNQLDALECTGKLHIPDVKNECSRSDIDDNGDVLKMFATHSGLHKDKIYIKEKSEKPLIKNENCFNNVELYAKNLCGRIDTHSTTDRCLLLLNKPIKPNVHSEIKAKNLSLKESVILQILHENKIKVSFKLMVFFFYLLNLLFQQNECFYNVTNL